jgi:hypothetical protein
MTAAMCKVGLARMLIWPASDRALHLRAAAFHSFFEAYCADGGEDGTEPGLIHHSSSFSFFIRPVF